METAPIFLVTVLYNSSAVLPAFLDCLHSQTYRNWRLIAVDNASADKSAELVEGFADTRIVVVRNRDNRGVAAANNQGIVAALNAEAKWVLLLNNDITFACDALEKLISRAEESRAELMTAKIVYYDRPSVMWYVGGRLARWRFFSAVHVDEGATDDARFNTPNFFSYAPTCFMLIHRNVFENIGLMWAPFFVYYDDVDFCYRAARAGYVVHYFPGVRVEHRVGSLTGGQSSPFSLRYGTRNRVLMIRRHAPIGLRHFIAGAYYFTVWARCRIRKVGVGDEMLHRSRGYAEGWRADVR